MCSKSILFTNLYQKLETSVEGEKQSKGAKIKKNAVLSICCVAILVTFGYLYHARKSKIALIDEVYKSASASYNKGHFNKAYMDYNKIIELSPNDPEAYNCRGIVEKERGNYDAAIADFSKAIEIDAAFAYGYNNRGTTYFKKGEFRKAVEEYNKAISIDPEDAAFYINLARVYATENNELPIDPAKVMYYAKLAMSLDRGYESMEILATAHELFGDFVKAERLLSDAIFYARLELRDKQRETVWEMEWCHSRYLKGAPCNVPYNIRDKDFSMDENDVITDRKTGLQWYIGPVIHDWKKAAPYCGKLTVAGNGWRVPTSDELRTLYTGKVNYKNNNSLPTIFRAKELNYYAAWTNDMDVLFVFPNGHQTILAPMSRLRAPARILAVRSQE